jgi:ADP-ribose pyrophosphatase
MKIPDHAQRVFKGVIYDVYHWEQEMFDGTKTTFEALKRPNTVVVIPTNGDKVYYAKQEQPGKAPFTSLFGGRAEEGEDPLDSAKRELLEETGFVSDDWQQIRQYTLPGKIDWSVYFFVARNCRKEAEQVLDGGEKIEILSTTVDDFINKIILDPKFSEFELRNELMSGFSAAKADTLKKDILG